MFQGTVLVVAGDAAFLMSMFVVVGSVAQDFEHLRLVRLSV